MFFRLGWNRSTWRDQTLTLTTRRIEELNPEPSRKTRSQSGSKLYCQCGFIDWEEWAEYEKDKTLTRPLQQPEDTSARRETDTEPNEQQSASSTFHFITVQEGNISHFLHLAAPPKLNACVLESGGRVWSNSGPVGLRGPPREPATDRRTSAN